MRVIDLTNIKEFIEKLINRFDERYDERYNDGIITTEKIEEIVIRNIEKFREK